MKPPLPQRHRAALLAGILVVIVLGLASRRYPGLFPTALGKYPGDALWALMVFLGGALIRPGASTGRLASAAMFTSFLVEFSQIYRAPWIDAVRATTAGHLVLGSTFSFGDLAAYAVGIGVGAVLDGVLWTKPWRRAGASPASVDGSA